VSRGNLFNPNQSSTWHEIGVYGINQNGVGLEANLGYEQRAQYGLENLGIGLTGPNITNQTVAGIATPEPFYLYVTWSCWLTIWKMMGFLTPKIRIVAYSESTLSHLTSPR
jgi:hypothetical protein